MDATVNDFLNEINEIIPPANKKSTKNACAWQECFDDSSGFPYYWNVKTNEVTWQMPSEYKDWLEAPKKPAAASRFDTLFPALNNSVKIYKIEEQPPKLDRSIEKPLVKRNNIISKRGCSDSEDDEKITLISSYGGDTESEEEFDDKNEKKENVKSPISKQSSKQNSDDDISQEKSEEKINDLITSSAIALVASYGDDSDEEDQQENIVHEKPTLHSTLFPPPQSIDINQFMETKPLENDNEMEDLNTKAFKRKRRIGVNLINVPRKPRSDDEDNDKHKGFGFRGNYTNFKSGGITFIKTDTLNPVMNGDSGECDVEESKVTLKEKLSFLSEGREAVSPVQIMLIQLDTLYAALKGGGLKSSYLNTWIKDTCEELVKLEEDAAPVGWLLEWDRSQKRYYYRNKVSDECQWDYPQAVEDDAMDICTTPPPQEDIEEEVDSPSSPNGSVKLEPPPPPVISAKSPTDTSNLDPPPPPVISQFTLGQPLPPGVDPEPSKAESSPPSNDLSSALDSFYSDIAAIESTIPATTESNITKELKDSINVTINIEPVKKKKKVKMAQGISMKKKGVSKLVEKWKNVQKDLE